MRLVDPLGSIVKEAAEAVYFKRQELGFRTEEMDRFLGAWKLQTRSALMIDAIMLFASALEEVGEISAAPILCNTTDNWIHGDSIYNYMKTVCKCNKFYLN